MSFWTRFGGVLGKVLGAFWTILGAFLVFEKNSNFEPEVEDRKNGSNFARGTRPRGLAALILIVDQSIVGIIDR